MYLGYQNMWSKQAGKVVDSYKYRGTACTEKLGIYSLEPNFREWVAGCHLYRAEKLDFYVGDC